MRFKADFFRSLLLAFAALVFAFLCALLALCLFKAVLPAFSFDSILKTQTSSVSAANVFPHAQTAQFAQFARLARIARVAFFTLFQALASLFVAVLIGLPMAFFCGRRRFFGRKFLLSLSSVPLCVPTLIVALGYITFFGNAGFLNKFFMAVFALEKPPFSFLYSFFGLVLAQGFYNFPLVMSTVSDAWARLPSEQADSARLLGAGEWRIFRTVTVFELMPSIVSACIPVFVYCFFSFMMILLFGGIGCSTLEVEIYQAARNTLDFKTAGILSMTETLIACVVVGFYVYLENKSKSQKGILSGEISALKPVHGFKEKCVFSALIFLVSLFFLAPIFSNLLNAFTSPSRFDTSRLYNFKRIFSSRSFFSSLRWTFLTAISTGLLCVSAGFFYSVILRKSQRFCLKVASMLPMAVSSIVTGFGLSLLFPRGNFLLLILAQSALFWPMAFRQIFPYISKIPDPTVDAARILSRSKSEIIFRIYLPVCRRGILSAFGFCFAMSAGDTSLPLVLSVPNFSTLSLFTYRLAGSYRFGESCAAGVVLAVLCAAMFSLAKCGNDGKGAKR
ncbi:MAG: iron ABC transporter permease [Treponema sp.]|nr:iron ABC transporter permease [Treponema sp.]